MLKVLQLLLQLLTLYKQPKAVCEGEKYALGEMKNMSAGTYHQFKESSPMRHFVILAFICPWKVKKNE